MLLMIIISLLLSACSSQDSISVPPMTEIGGRDPTRIPIYRVKAPREWTRQDPLIEESLKDTTKSLCEFFIYDQEAKIRITIHNFPTETITERIPPMAQIARWKKQFSKLDPTSVSVTPQAFGGFSGFLFEGSGILNGQHSTMMGWSMQIAPEHYSKLSDLDEKHRQMRADYTIKATGPTELIKKYRKAIITFARSFELIEEIPLQ